MRRIFFAASSVRRGPSTLPVCTGFLLFSKETREEGRDEYKEDCEMKLTREQNKRGVDE